MIAHIAPLRRMPNSLPFLSYLLPTELEPRIQRGSMVLIPLRGQDIPGLVLRLETVSDVARLKPISKYLGITLPEHSVLTLEKVAEYFASTLPYLTDALLPTPGKRWNEEIPPIETRNTKFANERRLIELNHASEESTILRNLADETIAAGSAMHVIVPSLEKAGLVADVFDGAYRVGIITSEVSPGKIWSVFILALRGELDVLITTRRGCLTPISRLGRTVVLDEESSDHKQWDMKPRYDARTVAMIKAETSGSGYIAISIAPRLTARQTLVSQTSLVTIPKILVHVNPETKNPFSQPTLDAIEDALDIGKKVAVLDSSGFSVPVPGSNPARLPALASEASLVIILFPDRMLFTNEWSAEERMHAELLRLTKRMRSDATLIIVATTAHRAFAGLLPGRRDEYFRKLIDERQEHNYPPFGSFIKLIVQSDKSLDDATQKAIALEASLKSPGVEMLGPYPADPAMVRGRFRALALLHGTPEAIRAVKAGLFNLPDEILVDIDPERIFR
ncbi:MAG: hypothetical protein WCJ29_01125 [bacterium]